MKQTHQMNESQINAVFKTLSVTKSDSQELITASEKKSTMLSTVFLTEKKNAVP